MIRPSFAAESRFAGSVLGARRHICAFFHSPDEEYQVLYPFIKDGFECGEKIFHVVDPQRTDEYLQRLAAAGIDVITTRQSGQFVLFTLGRKLGETSLVLSTVIGAKTGRIAV